MIQLPADFQDFLRLLNDRGVKYILVGGYAVGYYGFPRPTGDIDFWVGISSENATKIVCVLRDFGFDLPGLRDEPFLEENQIIRLGNPPFRIEILTSVSGITFEEAYNNRKKVFFDGIPVDLLSLADLRKNKKAADRDKDRIDLKNLP